MISSDQALAIRRLLMCVAALAATLGAHAASAHELAIVPAAPLIWGSLAALTVIALGRRGADWSERSFAEVLARLGALQVVLHIAMTAAPWAFGLTVHHRAALLAPVGLAAHAAAAILLAAILSFGERLLSAALRAARAILRADPLRRRARPAPLHEQQPAPRGPARTADRARGPPALAAETTHPRARAPRVPDLAEPRRFSMRAPRATVTLLACGLAAATAVPALAHTDLVSSGPRKGAVVTAMPKTIILNFEEPLQKVTGGAVLLNGTNYAVTTRLSAKNASQVRITTKSNKVGRYTVKATVTSTDGHTFSVSYRFRVKR
jgi:methionine-rich copper-binding protein CopC